MDRPKRTLIGNSVCLVPLEHAAQFFPGYTKNALARMMHALGVPLLYDKKGAHFNLYTLESVLHFLLYPGQPGIVLPASRYKLQSKHLRKDSACKKLGMDDSDLATLDSEEWRQRRIATGLNIFEQPRTIKKARKRTRPTQEPPHD